MLKHWARVGELSGQRWIEHGKDNTAGLLPFLTTEPQQLKDLQRASGMNRTRAYAALRALQSTGVAFESHKQVNGRAVTYWALKGEK